MVNHRRSVGACLAAGAVMALLSGCDLTLCREKRQHVPDAFDTVENTDFSPHFPQGGGATVGADETDSRQ